MHKGSSICGTLTDTCSVFDWSYPDGHEVIISSVPLICISLVISSVEHLSVWCWPSMYLHWRKVYSSPFLFLIRFFLFLLLGCRSSLYILDIDPFSGIKFSIIFSHSLSCLFPLFMVSFDKQKFLSLVQSRWSVLAFVTCDFSVISKR